MFGGPVMEHFVAINSAVAVFWGALVLAFTVGLEGFSILLFAVFIEILWIDLCAVWRHRGVSFRQAMRVCAQLRPGSAASLFATAFNPVASMISMPFCSIVRWAFVGITPARWRH